MKKLILGVAVLFITIGIGAYYAEKEVNLTSSHQNNFYTHM